MTLIDYAKYLLNVCGRRFTHLYRRHYLDSTPALPSLSALLSYLRTQTASIFTQIKARGAVHPLSGLPTTETLATLPTALATLSTRKVDVGTTTQIDDGVSLVRLLCDSTEAAKVTEIVDTNSGWTYAATSFPFYLMTNLQNITLRCKTITGLGIGVASYNELNLPELENTNRSAYSYIFIGEFETFNAPNFIRKDGGCDLFGATGGCRYFNAPKLQYVDGNNSNYTPQWGNRLVELNTPSLTAIGKVAHQNIGLLNCPNLKKVVFGKWNSSNTYYTLLNCPKTIHLEFGFGTENSLRWDSWNPTEALDNTISTLVDEGESFSNNREKFLYNFQTYILNRLQVGANKTLTVSSSVYSAVSGLTMPSGWTLASA